MSREDLAGQLRIERDQPSRRRSRRGPGGGRWLAIAGAVLLVGLIGAGVVWFMVARPDLAAVETAAAKPAWSGAARGGALLDASGFVVARRQATVSAKVSGKVAEVLIEEGQH